MRHSKKQWPVEINGKLPANAAARNAFSLLEVILALSILAGAVAVLGELLRTGVRNAQTARDLTRAQMLCEEIEAEVVGFSGDKLFLMPTGDIRGVMPGARVIPTHSESSAAVGDALLGRVLDGAGRPLDDHQSALAAAGVVEGRLDDLQLSLPLEQVDGPVPEVLLLGR